VNGCFAKPFGARRTAFVPWLSGDDALLAIEVLGDRTAPHWAQWVPVQHFITGRETLFPLALARYIVSS